MPWFVSAAACREQPAPKPASKLITPPPSTTSQPTSQATGDMGKPSPHPRTDERADERRRMVQQQIVDRGVLDDRVVEAMRQVPRHWFVPPGLAWSAYADRPLPIGHGQTISQPFIVAIMTKLLEIQPGDRVLEIGTGSGYQAAVLSELTDEVYTIEIVEPLARQTARLLKEKGYTTIRTRIGDGYRGWPEAAPFDAIIVTCAPETPPPALVEQLAIGGRLCIPVGSVAGDQELIVLSKGAGGAVIRDTIFPVRFVPMTGEAEGETESETER